MTDRMEELAARLKERFKDQLSQCFVQRDEVTAELPAGHLREICKALREEPEFAFEELMDLCGVDYSTYGQADWQTEAASNQGFSRGVGQAVYSRAPQERPRFAVVYHLLSIQHNRRLRLRVYAPEDLPQVDSVVDIWASANWFEREAFDLFGILFDGHPDLRRILTDYGFIGHPFRKDFPLEGNVEVRYDPEKGRVVYQPVTIENRVLVPRVIRRDERSSQLSEAGEKGHA